MKNQESLKYIYQVLQMKIHKLAQLQIKNHAHFINKDIKVGNRLKVTFKNPNCSQYKCLLRIRQISTLPNMLKVIRLKS